MKIKQTRINPLSVKESANGNTEVSGPTGTEWAETPCTIGAEWARTPCTHNNICIERSTIYANQVITNAKILAGNKSNKWLESNV